MIAQACQIVPLSLQDSFPFSKVGTAHDPGSDGLPGFFAQRPKKETSGLFSFSNRDFLAFQMFYDKNLCFGFRMSRSRSWMRLLEAEIDVDLIKHQVLPSLRKSCYVTQILLCCFRSFNHLLLHQPNMLI